MVLFLLALGAVLAVSGIALIGSGVSVQEHTFDPAILTLGAVTIIGGLIVIGLGWVVRALQHIELAIMARPAAHATQSAGMAATALSEPASLPPVRIPLPPRPRIEPQPQPQPAAVAAPPEPEPVVVPEINLEQPREKFPALVRIESTPIAAESEISLSSQPPGQLDELPGLLANGHAPAGANGVAPPEPQAESNVRPLTVPERRKGSVFESLWPKGPRGGRQAQTAVMQIPMPVPAEPEPRVELPAASVPVPIPQPAAVAISILKSGVVDGMAYTLYSDGSIEAQLPQGTLRFGSITELRNHIEHGS